MTGKLYACLPMWQEVGGALLSQRSVKESKNLKWREEWKERKIVLEMSYRMEKTKIFPRAAVHGWFQQLSANSIDQYETRLTVQKFKFIPGMQSRFSIQKLNVLIYHIQS